MKPSALKYLLGCKNICEEIENVYIVTDRVVICKGTEWIKKDPYATRSKHDGYDRVLFWGWQKKFNDGSLLITDYKWAEKHIRPLTKDEKYDLLLEYAEDSTNRLLKLQKYMRRIANV